MTPEPTHSRLERRCAQAILKAFNEYQRKFKMITQRAKARFEYQDWQGMKGDAAERLDLYREQVSLIAIEINKLLAESVNDKKIWTKTKVIYSDLNSGYDVWELAETFFNSVSRRIFTTVGVDPQIEFVDTCSRTQPLRIRQPSYRTYQQVQSTAKLMASILSDYKHQVGYKDMQRDAQLAAEKVDNHCLTSGYSLYIERAEMLTAVFYRGKRAYLVGRIFSGSDFFPLVLALLNTHGGIVMDAVLMSENDVSILFSFTRSYFHVRVERPAVLVDFLKSIMPRKRIAELYISIGFNKHGKSELYCDLLQHLNRSNQMFEFAEGEKGMVMEVFTMPDYDLVFKVIKDRFTYPKNTTREAVMAKYYLVFKHDRAGRLVDAQEFEYLKFNRNRFSAELIDGLKRVAARNLIISDDYVVIKHVYIERRVIPLDIYLGQVDEAQARTAVVDFGHAIKDLAAANIFPGDMLLKNFGVTRHGRVVFYDYDELCLLSSCNFRKMPQTRSYEDELSAEPWFAVGENDIFPEEFQNFLGLKEALREVFMEHHGDLFEVHFWHHIQSRIDAGSTIDIFPYEQSRRLTHSKL